MATAEEQIAIHECMQEPESPVIVELGAHRGEDEEWIRAACAHPVERYIMVEPDTRNAQFILDNTRRSFGPFRRLIVGAVWREDGRAEFHYSDNQRDRNFGSGSLRTPTGHLEHFPFITFPFIAMVPTYRLDTIFEREHLRRIDLLWVDIQGAERDMILGGETALRHTRFAFLEAEDVELYEGEALKPELIAMLQERGWELVQDFGYNILLRNLQFEERP